MDIFTVVARNEGESCFIAVEGTPYRIELSDPADFQHAWRVANFLIENVEGISAAPGAGKDAPAQPLKDGRASE